MIQAIYEETPSNAIEGENQALRTDIVKNLKVVSAGHQSIGDGRKIVTTAGTAVKLSATSVPCKQLTITALESNTDAIVVGGSTVVAGSTGDGGGTRQGTPLFATQSLVIAIADLEDIYIDSVVNGEGVSYSYLN